MTILKSFLNLFKLEDESNFNFTVKETPLFTIDIQNDFCKPYNQDVNTINMTKENPDDPDSTWEMHCKIKE